MATQDLISLALPLFEFLKQLQGERSQELPEGFGEILQQQILSFEHRALEHQFPSSHITEAKYALSALFDEAIMRSKWEGKSSWMNHSLQLKYFGEHLAGINFFERLAKIRQAGDFQLPVLEFYYLCLQLGFQGKYAMNQPEELKAMQSEIKQQLDLYRGSFDPILMIEGSTGMSKACHSKFSYTTWKLCLFGFLGILALYGIYAFRIHQLHQEAESRPQSYQRLDAIKIRMNDMKSLLLKLVKNKWTWIILAIILILCLLWFGLSAFGLSSVLWRAVILLAGTGLGVGTYVFILLFNRKQAGTG